MVHCIFLIIVRWLHNFPTSSQFQSLPKIEQKALNWLENFWHGIYYENGDSLKSLLYQTIQNFVSRNPYAEVFRTIDLNVLFKSPCDIQQFDHLWLPSFVISLQILYKLATIDNVIHLLTLYCRR